MTGGQATAKKVQQSSSRSLLTAQSIKCIKFGIVWEIGNLEVAKTTNNLEHKQYLSKCVSIMLLTVPPAITQCWFAGDLIPAMQFCQKLN